MYLVNDVADRESDRQHPLKTPAADRLGRAAGAGGGRRGRSSHRRAAWRRPPVLGGRDSRSVAAAYLALLSSSTPGPLKHIVIIDVLTIAIGFVLRAVAGAVAIDVVISHWLLVCTILLALFIALAKRRHETRAAGRRRDQPSADSRRVQPYLLDQMIAVVTASTLIAYIFYTISPETRAEVRDRVARADDSVSACTASSATSIWCTSAKAAAARPTCC